MSVLQVSWIQASSHPADTDRLVLEGLLNPSGAPFSGARYGVGSGPTELAVTQNGTPNMSVNVAAGHAWIDGTEGNNQGVYALYNDATLNVVVAASDPTNPRKDLVVARVQDAAYSGATNSGSVAVVTGTAAASPAEPAVPANAIVLALVDVAAAASSITNANITDRRRRACALGGTVVCTSATRPTTGLYEGLHIYETDTDKIHAYDGAAWVQLAALGAWDTYTPAVGGTGWALGNGTALGRFTRSGRTVTWEALVTFGSTSTFGSASLTLSLPVAAANTNSVRRLGNGFLADVTGGTYVATAGPASSTTVTVFRDNVSGSDIIRNTVISTTPFTWAVNDQIYLTGSYEAAS